MEKAKVSIIVPIYNTERYLDACIRSVLNQTYTNWELILVNDGSNDGSGRICQTYSTLDKRIIYILQENFGVSAARNAGIFNSTGDYFAFLDSDDELESNAIELLLCDIIKYDADMSSALKGNVLTSGNIVCSRNDGEVNIYTKEETIKLSLMYDGHSRSVCAKLFTKKLIDDVRFVEGRCINEDGYFLFQCYLKQPKVVQHNVCVYKYYQRENSCTHSGFTVKYFDMIYFCDLKMKYIKEYMPHLLEYAKDMEVRTNLLFLDVLCRSLNSEYKCVEKKSIGIVRKRFLKYRAQNKHEKLMKIVVTFGMYPVYKLMYRIKFRNKKYR